MAPLQYVFVYVSSDYHFWKILLQYVVAICVFRLLPYANSAPHSLQLNGFSSLCILVFGGNTAQHSLQKKFFSSPVCGAISVFRWLPFENPASYSLQQNSFSPANILGMLLYVTTFSNPAPYSLQINCFPPVCVCIQHFSWLQSYTAAQVDRQSLGRSALPYTPYTLPV